MSFDIIRFEKANRLLDWLALTKALEAGHRLPKAEIGDTFLYRDPDTLLTRSAWIDGMGLLVKAATVFPDNPERDAPMVNGTVNLFSDDKGVLEALIDFHLVTKWKTAGDSLLAALKLARSDSRNILIVGAGTVARSLIEAYGAGFPDAHLQIWNRNPARATDLAETYPHVEVLHDLEWAVRGADIVSVATMATSPLIHGEWLHPGQHLDLIGAYRPDMREADDEALRRARIFVDCRDTVLDHIGELKTPLAEGVISHTDVVADFYDLPAGRFGRQDDTDITLFKNGGGAHLDLMTSRYVLDQWRKQ